MFVKRGCAFAESRTKEVAIYDGILRDIRYAVVWRFSNLDFLAAES